MKKTARSFELHPDELRWKFENDKLIIPTNLRLASVIDGQHRLFGFKDANPNAKEMHFHFGQLIAHAARTRDLAAGSLIGSGTVSNEDPTRGSSCLAEKRMIEQIKNGKIETPFMKAKDTIEIEMKNSDGQSIFGRIFQQVVTL